MRGVRGVRDVAVVGAPDDAYGQVPVAFVEADAEPGRDLEANILASCRGVAGKVQGSPACRDPYRAAARGKCEDRQGQASSDALNESGMSPRAKQCNEQFHWIMALASTRALAAQAALAQSYPTRPVRVITLTAAGGSLDIMARTLAQSLSESTGQQFYVENKVGAGGNLGVVGARTVCSRRLHDRDDHGLDARHQSEPLRIEASLRRAQ